MKIISRKGATPIEPFLGKKKENFEKVSKRLFCKNYWSYIVETCMVIILDNGYIPYELSRVQPQFNPFETLELKNDTLEPFMISYIGCINSKSKLSIK